jgi:hypothetical protein
MVESIMEGLPNTLDECWSLIRELRRELRPTPWREGEIVGRALGVEPMAGSFLIILAKAKRPLTWEQIDGRFPLAVRTDQRIAKNYHVHAYRVRKALGRWALITHGHSGYTLHPAAKDMVLEALNAANEFGGERRANDSRAASLTGSNTGAAGEILQDKPQCDPQV